MRKTGSLLVSRPHGGRVCLAVLALLGSPLVGSAGPVWCSPFEEESGQPVTHEQIADAVENAVGEPGEAAGGLPMGLNAPLYLAHGQAIVDVPSDIDPANAAAGFAISLPDDRRTGINTNLRSNAGNLANALTFEGYFYMPNADPITALTFIGRRLVSQKRSDNDGESRLAIGPHAHTTVTGAVDGLFEYEGFDYTGNVLEGQAGGIGFAGPWTNATTFAHLSNDGVSLDSDAFPFTPVGSRINGTGGTSARPLSRPINLGAEGEVTYLSALVAKAETTAGTARNLEIGLATSATVGGTGSTIRIGSTSGHQFFLNVATNATGAVQTGTAYFVLVKIMSHAAAPDQCFMSIYDPAGTVPTEEPTSWDLTHELSSSAVLTHLRLTLGAQQIGGQFDEIRMGSTYASAIDPDAPLGDPGQVHTANKLSVFWVETDGAVPPVFTNHLELGTTDLLAERWYHFAVVYDGTDIRWYLDGELEGEVLSPPNMVSPGNAKIAIGNNRTFGTDDRGFFGVLDEIRLWDRALATNELLVEGGGPGEGLLWRSRFETNRGQPVTHGQPAETINCIDNSNGPPNGTPAGISATLYAAYGQTGVPAVPADIDPSGLAESFALSFPDLANVGVNTGIPSNSRDFANAITVQGYFNSLRTVPVATTAVGSRLVSTSRSGAQNQARLAIGLAANPSPPVEGPPNVLSIAYFSTVESAVLTVTGTTPIDINKWYHFAMVYDGTDIRWYLDGELEGTVPGAPLIAPGSANMSVGNDTSTGGGQRGFYGLMDKVVISDHVIAPTEFMTDGFDACLGVFCNIPFADFDYDDDVDMMDFASLQRCISTGGAGITVGCECFDRDADEDVDLEDVAAFEACGTGPSVLWTPGATPNCTP